MPPQTRPRLSLFELALVVAVLVFIGASAGVAALPRCIESSTQRARSEASIIEISAEIAVASAQDDAIAKPCPTIDTLIAQGDLSPNTSVRDPWNRPYDIVCDTSGVRARSAGPDRILGTRDDL